MVTAGNRAPQVEFHIGFVGSVNVHNSICLVYAKFNGLSCMVPSYRFWGGPIYRFTGFVHISDKKSCNTKVAFNHFDRDSYSSIDYSNFRVSIAAIAMFNYQRVTNGKK